METPKDEDPRSAYFNLDVKLEEKYESAPLQLAEAAALWITEAVERRIYSHGLTGAQVDGHSLKNLKKSIDLLNLSLKGRSNDAIDRFLRPSTNTGNRYWLHSQLSTQQLSIAVKRLDDAFRNAFRYVVYPIGQYLKEAKLLDCPVDEGDALTSGADIANVGWIPTCAPEPRLAIQEELSDGLQRLLELARRRDALSSKKSAQNWLEAWQELNRNVPGKGN